MRAGIYVRVSTDEQRDNGYSIDSQLRMGKEYCEKMNYDIVGVYNDGGYSGKDLMRPDMQKLLHDIKSKKLDKLVAIKVDRLTRNNYDGFWLLNYCEEYDVKIELILEPYDVSTANGEMIFGLNVLFGQRERKEIGARTKRALDQMAIERKHPCIAPYGYTKNKETGHLEVDPVESLVVKEIFDLCKKGHSMRNIANILDKENIDIAYDIHIRRLFLRLGLVDQDIQEEILDSARRMNPEFPGKLTTAFWNIGREICRPTNPSCLICPLFSECDRNIDKTQNLK